MKAMCIAFFVTSRYGFVDQDSVNKFQKQGVFTLNWEILGILCYFGIQIQSEHHETRFVNKK